MASPIQQVYNVTEGQPLNQSFGFVANSVTINNLTQSWAYVTPAQLFIPPYQYGVVVPIPGTDIADITWRTPTSLPVGPVGTGTLSATYTDTALPASAGQSVFTQQTQVVLGSVAPSSSKPFTIPAGCQALLLAAEGTLSTLISVQVTGLTTGAVYGIANLIDTGQVAAIVPVSAIADPRVNVTVGFTIVNILVIALFTSAPE